MQLLSSPILPRSQQFSVYLASTYFRVLFASSNPFSGFLDPDTHLLGGKALLMFLILNLRFGLAMLIRKSSGAGTKPSSKVRIDPSYQQIIIPCIDFEFRIISRTSRTSMSSKLDHFVKVKLKNPQYHTLQYVDHWNRKTCFSSKAPICFPRPVLKL